MERLSDWLDRAGLLLAAISLVSIFMLTMGEIVLRPLGLSIIFATDLYGFLMVAAIFLALGEVTRRREHISADFFVGLLRKRIQHLVEHVISPIATALYVTGLLWVMWGLALDSYIDGVRSEGILRLPLAIPQSVLLFGLLLMLLRLAVMLSGRKTNSVTERSGCAQ
jgi:TRAP-type C4-dicarboxylate transport system permease small subunit